jgi:Flp pilus assembly protein TadD
VRAYNEDGVYLFQGGDFASARESFQAALELTPADSGLLYNLGQCYDRLGDATRAERYYGECLRQASNHAAARQALAALLVRQGRWEEAAQLTRDWLEREPKLAAAHAMEGWLLHQAGDLPQAQARLQHALELDPKNVAALTELARVYEELQRPDRAVVLYERVLERDRRQVELARRINQLRADGVRRPQPD